MKKAYIYRVVYINRNGNLYEDKPFFYEREEAVEQATADIRNHYMSDEGYDFIGFYVVNNNEEPLV